MSFTPSDPTAIATPTDAPLSTSSSVWRRLLPLQHLGIVLLVSLPGPIAASLYSLVGGPRPTTPMQQNYRFVLGVIAEVTALILLWYVMPRQGRTWTDIGWKFGLADVFRGLALYAVVRIVEVLVWNLVQYVYMRSTGHWLVPKSLSVVSYGISFLSVAYICLAPFFEELIVRAYTMSEIMGAGGNVGVAIVVSVALQMSYHLYQGFANLHSAHGRVYRIFDLLRQNATNRADSNGTFVDGSDFSHSTFVLKHANSYSLVHRLSYQIHRIEFPLDALILATASSMSGV